MSLEVCWVMQHWKDMGWDIDYIIDQSLKWHISSFNGKSSAVPKEWWPQVDRWLKKMGYRFVLRKFTYPEIVKGGGKLEFTSWWRTKERLPVITPSAWPFDSQRISGVSFFPPTPISAPGSPETIFTTAPSSFLPMRPQASMTWPSQPG